MFVVLTQPEQNSGVMAVMSDLWFDLALVGALVGVNAMLAGTEMAFVTLREGQLRRLADSGRRGARVAELAHNPNRYLGAVQLGITLSGFLASATAAVSISEPVADVLAPLGRFSQPMAIAIVTILLALVTLVVGELVPKRLAMQRAEAWSLAVARPVSVFIAVTRPVIVLLSWLTDGAVRAVGGDPTRHTDDITDDEIVELVKVQPTLSEAQRQIMAGAIEIAGRPLRKVLVPRNRVVTVDESRPAVDALRQLRTAGHSRAPVVNGDLDSPVGQVHLRDLIDATGAAGELATPMLELPETLSVLEALRRLQASRTELAAVIDEHGGTAGAVTIEDLIEELVGEIWNETDPDLLAVHRDPTGAFVLPGSFPIHDLGDLGIDLPAGHYDTIAGLVLDLLGHIPEVGERVFVVGYEIDVAAMDRRSITSVRVTPMAPPSGPEGVARSSL